MRNIGLPDIGCFEKDAVVTDRDAPTPPSNVQFTTGQTEIVLEWDESSDNTGISFYETTVNGNDVFTSKSSNIQITRLEPAQEYTIEIVAVDNFGNKSTASIISAVTSSEELLTVHFVPSHRHDQLIKSNLKLMWVGMPTINVGDYINGADATALIPFQLPCINNQRTIVSADVLLNVEAVEGSPMGNIDLYLMEMRTRSDVLTTDYYAGPSSEANSGIIIAENLINDQTIGGINLSSGQQITLGSELNELYNTGACNKFAFIRLNSNFANEPNNSYYSISSSDNLNSYNRPLLKIISNASTSIANPEVVNGLQVLPNPTSGQNLIIAINDEFESKQVLLEIHNSQGHKVLSKMISIGENNIQISTDLSPGVYYATLLSKEKYAQTKFIKI